VIVENISVNLVSVVVIAVSKKVKFGLWPVLGKPLTSFGFSLAISSE